MSDNFYYVDGKVSACRRCKRKRTLDEDPVHLQFKTCFRCRMIERDQKKNNSKRRTTSNFEPKLNSSREELEKLNEQLKTTTRAYRAVTKQFNPTATSAPASAIIGAGDSEIKDLASYQYKNGQFKPPAGDLNYTNFDQTMAMLEHSDLQMEDVEASEADLAYNEQLFSFNILSIDPKLNPLSLTPDQQSLLQLSFLAKYHHDQSNNSRMGSHELSPNNQVSCLTCKCNLPKQRLNIQVCQDCENKQSTMKDFNHFLTILKLNTQQDMYRIIFMTNISLDELLKSSLSDNKSSQNVLKLLYEKYVTQINEITNAEFLLPNENNDEPSNDAESSENKVLKKVLKCASDHSTLSFTDSAIDPEALNLSVSETNNSNSHSVECKFSQLCLNYDMESGDLVICLSHSAHV